MAGEKNIEKPLVEKNKITVSKVEKINNSENPLEQTVSIPEKFLKLPKLLKELKKSQPVKLVSSSDFQQQRAIAIDHILAAGLNEIFLHLKADEQQAFKKKGEETVTKINELLNKTKIRVNKLIALIRDWLKLIPGVNKFFLEQEAKIKADQILKIKDKF